MNKEIKRIKLTEGSAFKQFFMSSDQVLRAMLKSFLPINETISDIKFIDLGNVEDGDKSSSETPVQTPEVYIEESMPPEAAKWYEKAVLDLYVQLSNGESINVQLQAAFDESFMEWSLFYWGRLYCSRLTKGTNFEDLVTTYSLVFTTFPMVDKEEEEWIHSFSLRLKEHPHMQLCEYLQIMAMELGKLPEDYRQLVDLRQKWGYLFRNSAYLAKVACEHLAQEEDIKMGLELLDYLSQNKITSLER